MIYIPSFELFGELFLDDLAAGTSTCTGPAPWQGCVWQQSLLPLITFLYMFMTNIVLVNLLIAIMGDTYQREKKIQDKKWVRERYVNENPPFLMRIAHLT